MNTDDTSKPQKISTVSRFRNFTKKHKAASIIIGSILLLFVAGTITFFALYRAPQFDTTKPIAKPKPTKYYSSLTGVEVSDEAATKLPVTAVMIENSPDARPQSGVGKAGVVYEAVAEGGITRFLAVYQGEKPALIGPVRSLRYYYLNWAAPYQASIAHVGGSYNALAEVQNGSYRDIDQSFNASAYWRASDRYAPHNMYTSGDNLDTLNAEKNYTSSDFKSFARMDGKAAAEPNATSVTINFSSPLYNTSYTYDAETNSYARSLAGAPHNDRENGRITVASIVAMDVQTVSRGGSDGYEDITTTGTGLVRIFQNGTVTEGTWRKESMNSPLELIDAEGKAIKLVRGQTWIAAVTGRGGVSWQ